MLNEYISKYNDGYYFMGESVSSYGIESGYVDYRCIAKSFQMVLCNDIISATGWDSWEIISGQYDYTDEIEEIDEKLDELELSRCDLDNLIDLLSESPDDHTEKIKNLEKELEEIETDINSLEEEKADLESMNYEMTEIFQYYIIQGPVDILQDMSEPLFYNNDLGIYVWGITHYGTSWDYVLTNIEIDKRG